MSGPAPVADDGLAAGLARWLADHRDLPDPVVHDLSRPRSGYSSDTTFVEVSWSDGGERHRASLVVRTAPRTDGTFTHYDLVPQYEAQLAAAAVGVPVADPVLETDYRWIGVPFLLMPRVDGHVVGAVAHRDPWLAGLGPDRRARIYDDLLATVATVHRADPASAPSVPRRDNGAELDFWEEYLSWSTDGHPVAALGRALRWCRRHRPPDDPPSALLWGDVRFENTVLDDDGRARAVLDWDMTSVGAPEHDLAWFTSLDLTMHRMFGERTAGFPDRQATVARFEELSGRSVCHLEWYETLAMVRSTAIMTRINVLRRDAGKPVLLPIDDNPLLDLLTERLA